MANIQGLPDLPKSLSGLLNTHTANSWRDLERLYTKQSMIQDDLSRSQTHHMALFNGSNGSNGANGHDHPVPGARRRPKLGLEASIALLRREMDYLLKSEKYNMCAVSLSVNLVSPLRMTYSKIGLRQMDVSLLCKLWSLYEGIQEVKQSIGEPTSESGSFSMDSRLYDHTIHEDSREEDDEDEEEEDETEVFESDIDHIKDNIKNDMKDEDDFLGDFMSSRSVVSPGLGIRWSDIYSQLNGSNHV
ncbi:protein FAM89A-like isoform X1 [Branchiostoma floridae]|uniref:Protein FAM89A-like isoform X1 n=1 Tax=Branchiostoma floridae TaxID=7739 RepID=A0A9J7M4A8_BRAFL|nr:protein FAM89A-like isoform X1 [Branchiostoma floridae]